VANIASHFIIQSIAPVLNCFMTISHVFLVDPKTLIKSIAGLFLASLI